MMADTADLAIFVWIMVAYSMCYTRLGGYLVHEEKDSLLAGLKEAAMVVVIDRTMMDKYCNNVRIVCLLSHVLRKILEKRLCHEKRKKTYV